MPAAHLAVAPFSEPRAAALSWGYRDRSRPRIAYVTGCAAALGGRLKDDAARNSKQAELWDGCSGPQSKVHASQGCRRVDGAGAEKRFVNILKKALCTPPPRHASQVRRTRQNLVSVHELARV
jgi:hypothetical protein